MQINNDEVAYGSKPGCEPLYVRFLVDRGECRLCVETMGEKSSGELGLFLVQRGQQ